MSLAKINFKDIICSSAKMKKVIALAKKASESDVTVLLIGKSGTGKELLCHAIHNLSTRREGPLIELNCAAIPENLVESELFGHEKGAFTGAIRDKKGKFEMAHQGTLFLDEIDEMALPAQAKLLKAIEMKRFERVGGTETISVDIRIIAAANKDITKEIKEGRFREDLYYRLKELQIDILPLRERLEDIDILVDHFIKKSNKQFHKNVKRISDVARAILVKHTLPGNVRELESVIKSAISLIDREVIWIEDLPIETGLKSADIIPESTDYSLAEIEKIYILKVLNKVGWNKLRAASMLKVSRPRLDRKIKAYKIKKT